MRHIALYVAHTIPDVIYVEFMYYYMYERAILHVLTCSVTCNIYITIY